MFKGYTLAFTLLIVSSKGALLLILICSFHVQSCEEMLNYDGILDSLGHYARSRDSVLQKVVIKMIFCVMDLKELRYKQESPPA